jgi:hypothetical protein
MSHISLLTGIDLAIHDCSAWQSYGSCNPWQRTGAENMANFLRVITMVITRKKLAI